MIMRLAVSLFIALAADPALAASFDCTIERQCGGGACDPFTGGPLVLEETGDMWQVSLDGTVWQAYASTTIEDGGEVSLVIPPQGGMSGLITVMPSGQVAFTVHANSEIGLVAITGEGNCTGEGG
jgi:hypothetical protein